MNWTDASFPPVQYTQFADDGALHVMS